MAAASPKLANQPSEATLGLTDTSEYVEFQSSGKNNFQLHSSLENNLGIILTLEKEKTVSDVKLHETT